MNSTRQRVLAIGLRHCERMTVAPHHTVPQIEPSWPGFKDMPPVFATAMMVAFMEQTCIVALRPFLTPEQRTVGTHIDMSHVAPTAVDMEITAEIELVGIQGKSLTFKVCCRDADGTIGAGTHQRVIIDMNRFIQRLHDKVARARPRSESGR